MAELSMEHAGSARTRGLVVEAAAYAVALVAAVATGWALRGRHPILVAAAADFVGTVVVFAFSVRFDNSSIYDPYWSVAPIPIAVFWTAAGESAPGPRQALVLALVFAWGLRLTANCVARWGGLGDEDFRYVEIRGRTGRAYWPASFVAIHLMPTIWVFLGLLPLHPALGLAGRPFGALDVVAAVVTGGAIVLEAIADLQLRRFARARKDPSDVLESGAWSLSRHPNYLGEVLFWWGLFLFGLAAAPEWAWTAVGPLSITLLFLLVSVPWMDRRMLARHPGWVERLRNTPALFPWPRRHGRRAE